MRNTCVTSAVTPALFTKITSSAKENHISTSSFIDIAIRRLLRHPPEELAEIIASERKKHE